MLKFLVVAILSIDNSTADVVNEDHEKVSFDVRIPVNKIKEDLTVTYVRHEYTIRYFECK